MAQTGDGGEGGPDDRQLTVMTTVHFTLATARASTIAEANGRASLFLTTVSMAMVALGFIAQATEIGAAFYVFAFATLAVLLLVGLVTFDRVAQTGVEDGLLARGQARVRAFYAQAAPGVERWFVEPAGEDDAAELAVVGGRSPIQILLTTGGMVGVVNSAILGVGLGLAARLAGAALGLAAILGAGALLLAMVAHVAHMRRLWRRGDTLLAGRQAAGGERR